MHGASLILHTAVADRTLFTSQQNRRSPEAAAAFRGERRARLFCGITEYVPVEPVVGKVLLFPGWLPHCVLPLQDPKGDDGPGRACRFSIAFNFFLS